VSIWGKLKARRPDTPTEVPPATSDSTVGNAASSTRADTLHTVEGERGIPALDRTQSVQARFGNALALGLMSALALGFLVWYYTQTFAERSDEKQSAAAAIKTKTQGEMTLPPLGRIDPPTVERVLGPPPPLPEEAAAQTLLPPPNTPAASAWVSQSSGGRSPDQGHQDRRLAGPVFVGASGAGGGTHTYETEGRPDSRPSLSPLASSNAQQPAASSDMAALLEPTSTPAALAKVLPTQQLLLAKGSFLDCTLETAIDSSLPGMTTCVTATDTFSVDGSVVLLERGTKLVGETRGQVQQGTTRVYVLWTEARTPTGVVVPLASPGTDGLGRSGLPGEVNRHFWERFGAAILVSVIDGVVQAAGQNSGSGDDTVVISPSTSRDVMTEILRSTINIRPTVTKQNGDRIAVLVARDLDFRAVYELHPVAERR
jgi:type IV secretion system protein VirB10